MNSEHALEWQFGGWQGVPAWLGWCLLILLAVGGVVLASWLYRDTLRKLSARQQLIFTCLRSGFFLALLLCLAGPAAVERTYDANQDARPLAVVVDRSPSMTVADSHGTTRLDFAVRIWKQAEAAAVHAFPHLSYFHFSNGLATAPDFETAVTTSDTGGDTHLFDSLDDVLKNAPAGGYSGIVCLTDGLDTTNATADDLSRRALGNHSPLYFAVGQNHQAAQDTLFVRELSVPGQALRKSRFTTTILVEAHASHDRDVALALQGNGQPLAQTTLHLHAGNNLVPWTVPVDAGEPGILHLDCRLGDGAEQESLAAAVPIVASDKINILFYQGTLDWSYRFVNSALQGDASFSLTGLFNPDLNMTEVSGTTNSTMLTELPSSPDPLRPFQIVVLSSVFADQLTSAQQAALVNYVLGGGGLLFLVSDNKMAQSFSNTALEAMLPVVFEAPPSEPTHEDSVAQFQDTMRSIGGVNFGREDEFANDAQAADGPAALKPFALPANYRPSDFSRLFSKGDGSTLQNLPQFTSYARVHGVKAGGEVLAVHPEDKTDANEPRALLVTQRYGKGQVTTLLTDALWRWRLSLPSTVHDPEIFWQQLFLALARNSTGAGATMRFAEQPFSGTLGQTCAFRLDAGAASTNPSLTAISPSGKVQAITAQPGTVAGTLNFQVVPDEPGAWRIRATDSRGALTETLLRVSSASHKVELSGLPPDTDALRKLAEATGGSLLNDGVPDTWAVASAPAQASLVSKHSHPLWNSWAVLLFGLGIYAVELVWRRRAKLL